VIPVPNTTPQQYTASLKVTDRPIYGSKRIGSYTRQMELVGEPAVHAWPYVQPMQAPLKRYELTDHLGNVAAVVSGRLVPGNGAGSPYQPELMSAQGYEAFGSLMPGRNYSSDSYRFGFQGQIKDDEVYGATGTSYAFDFRMHDPRVGRFWSIDPLTAKYPFYSPYAFSGNRVIDMIELEGLEPTATAKELKATGDENAAWGFGARGNENTNWQENINHQLYQTYQCSDCYSNNDRGDRQGLANPLMWKKVPRTGDDEGGGSAPTGDNRTGQSDKPVLDVPKAKAGMPTPPPVSRKPAALPINQPLAIQAPIYANGDLLNRDDAMGAEQYGAIDKMISAINANSSNYNSIQLSVQIGTGNDPQIQYRY
jgi:RHS repeat-associated protein